MGKRVKRKLADLRQILKRSKHADPIATGVWLGQVLEGWMNYYVVPTSYATLSSRRVLKRSRRSQKARPDWEQLEKLCKLLWAKVRIRHEWPDRRFAANHSR